MLEEARTWVKIQLGPAEAWRCGIACGIARPTQRTERRRAVERSGSRVGSEKTAHCSSEGLLERQKCWGNRAFAGLNVEWGRDACVCVGKKNGWERGVAVWNGREMSAWGWKGRERGEEASRGEP